MAQDASVSAATLASSLSRLKHYEGTSLVDLLVESSISQFRLYVRICSIDRSFAPDDQLCDKDAIIIETFEKPPERKEDIRATLDADWEVASLGTSTNNALDKAEETPEDPVPDAASSSLPAFEPADPKIRQLIHNLPSELLLLIQDNLLHLTLGPRRIYPFKEHLNVDVFEALDHQLLAKYQPIFFCDNIWAIGQGDRDDSVAFLDHMPVALKQSIRKVELSFTTHDHVQRSLDFYFDEDAQDMRNALEVLRSYRDECAAFVCRLTMTWWEKFYEVALLQLDYCILDFTEAYAPDGEYLGVQVARTLSSFCYGRPAEFFIYAPTQDLADQIWDLMY